MSKKQVRFILDDIHVWEESTEQSKKYVAEIMTRMPNKRNSRKRKYQLSLTPVFGDSGFKRKKHKMSGTNDDDVEQRMRQIVLDIIHDAVNQ